VTACSKDELGCRFGQAVKSSEDDATGRQGSQLRAQRRYSTGNRFSIDEVNEPGVWHVRTCRTAVTAVPNKNNLLVDEGIRVRSAH
jgi:hypothetical protein